MGTVDKPPPSLGPNWITPCQLWELLYDINLSVTCGNFKKVIGISKVEDGYNYPTMRESVFEARGKSGLEYIYQVYVHDKKISKWSE